MISRKPANFLIEITHCDLEQAPRAGRVVRSVADAKRMIGEGDASLSWGYALTRWGSSTLPPRLSKSAAPPLTSSYGDQRDADNHSSDVLICIAYFAFPILHRYSPFCILHLAVKPRIEIAER